MRRLCARDVNGSGHDWTGTTKGNCVCGKCGATGKWCSKCDQIGEVGDDEMCHACAGDGVHSVMPEGINMAIYKKARHPKVTRPILDAILTAVNLMEAGEVNEEEQHHLDVLNAWIQEMVWFYPEQVHGEVSNEKP